MRGIATVGEVTFLLSEVEESGGVGSILMHFFGEVMGLLLATHF